ncbi:hypothetical protein BDP27DRAFT_1340243 [Rhodocollybia butyracea]|uniref:Uncharacterized protein n=1 Tax=Rhodocollybia butyracea TaxID=206335 RepID=A0A9P5P878_9AGAR|nr:hypothetical protein BDP27DRAFT_1340243 [Rhodocollybia butyracea]
MYSNVLLFKNDHTRNELLCSTETAQEYHVVKLIAEKLGLYHHSVGEGDERCAVVTRVDTRVDTQEQEPEWSAEPAVLASPTSTSELQTSIGFQPEDYPFVTWARPFRFTVSNESDPEYLEAAGARGLVITSALTRAMDSGQREYSSFDVGQMDDSEFVHGSAPVFGMDNLLWDDLLHQAWKDYHERIGQ